MVAAYLRGILKPTLDYGLRSVMSENLLLEATSALIGAEAMATRSQIDAAYTAVLQHDTREAHLRAVIARAARSTELKLFDVHRLGQTRVDSTKDQGKLSLFQLYQLLQKKGILEAMRSHYSTQL